MRHNLTGIVWRLAIFVTVCVLGAFALIAIYAQLRFQGAQTFNAIFSTVTGLKNGNFVRIAGVEVGKVKNIRVRDDATVQVTFSTDDSVVLTEGTQAVIRYADLIGGRYLALEQGPGSPTKLSPGGTIPADSTSPALDLDALIGGFRPLFRALDPEQVNSLSSQLIAAFQGQGPTIGSILAQIAVLTNTLADRDALIGQVVVNLNIVLGSLGDRSDKLGTAIDSLSELMRALADRKQDLADSLAYSNEAAGSIADLLS
ncbi:MAG: MCE family protein, partial [Mycobacterium sp.]